MVSEFREGRTPCKVIVVTINDARCRFRVQSNGHRLSAALSAGSQSRNARYPARRRRRSGATSILLSFVVVTNVVFWSSQTFASSPPDKQISVPQLVELSPIISTDSGRIERLRAKGTRFDDDSFGRFDFVIQFETPNHWSLEVLDSRDFTPVMVLINSDLVMYDVIAGELLRVKDAYAYADLRCEAGSFVDYTQVGCDDSPSRVVFDFKSLFERKPVGEVLTRFSPREARLIRTYKNGSTLELAYDLTRKLRVVTIIDSDASKIIDTGFRYGRIVPLPN
jgi:hypothetical protein